MIIANGVPKSGTTLLVSYLRRCGCTVEPIGLVADRHGDAISETAKPYGGLVRPLADVLAYKGNDRVVGAHVHDAVELSPIHKVAFIVRHPRNVIVSWARMTNPENPAGVLTEEWFTWNIERMRDFIGWFDRADAVFRYETFAEDVASMTEKLELPPLSAEPVLGENAPWMTPTYRGTWTGRASDWREYWHRPLERDWVRCGGREIEKAFGY